MTFIIILYLKWVVMVANVLLIDGQHGQEHVEQIAWTHRERKIIWTEILDRSDWNHFKVFVSNDSDSNVWVKKQHSIKVVSKIYFRKSQILKPDIAKKSFTFTSPTKSFSNKWTAKGFARQISNLHTMSLQHLWWSLNNKVDCYESFFLPWKFSSKSRLISSLKW